ncbi:sensor histidine kinase [Natrarchaeobius oligotrophus]|nr:HAMP domain-containing sensor histidine kinase [Natrarchaeobius chitinivorans]
MRSIQVERLLHLIGTVRWSISIGAGIGLGIGLLEARAINRQLATDRVRLRQAELQRERDRLDEFASVVSHDLRNPLNVAAGRIQLARETHDSDHLKIAEQSLDRIETLIDDLLTLAREGKAVTDPEPVDLESLVRECWRNVEVKRATYVTAVGSVIEADESRLRQVFENLFRNAIEHAGADVTVTVGELDDGFYVEDDGPGIPDADRGDVFDASYSTSGSGSGFGLSIVKQIVEAHGWEIRVIEGDEGGARFEITGVERVGEKTPSDLAETTNESAPNRCE